MVSVGVGSAGAVVWVGVGIASVGSTVGAAGVTR